MSSIPFFEMRVLSPCILSRILRGLFLSDLDKVRHVFVFLGPAYRHEPRAAVQVLELDNCLSYHGMDPALVSCYTHVFIILDPSQTTNHIQDFWRVGVDGMRKQRLWLVAGLERKGGVFGAMSGGGWEL